MRGVLWIACAFAPDGGRDHGRHPQVDSGGKLVVLDNAAQTPGGGTRRYRGLVVVAVCWVASLAGQVLSYRRSSGQRRQQLKWLITGTAIGGACLGMSLTVGSPSALLPW